MSGVDALAVLAAVCEDKPSFAEAHKALAAVAELVAAGRRIAEYADDDYVPNVAFARLIQALAAFGGSDEK